MEALRYLVGLLFVVGGAVCVASVALSLPGTWVLLAVAVLVELLDGLYLPEGLDQTFSWQLLFVCALAAGVGELLEFLAGVLGAKRAGSGSRGAWGALLGGLVGAVAGIAVPVPFLGPLIGSLIGTFLGALLGERSVRGSRLRSSLRPATGATLGRILGTIAKIPIAMAVWVALSVAAFTR